MTGLYFEEFEEGQVFDHAMSRTVSEMDNVLFCSLTMNPQPLHLDEEFAKQTEFGQRLVNSLFTLGLVIGISVGETTLGTTVANLGISDVRFPKPVFHGDTLRVRTVVRAKRRSQSRRDAGIVEFEHQGINQRGETARRREFERTLSSLRADPLVFAVMFASTPWQAGWRSMISSRSCPKGRMASCCQNASPRMCVHSIITSPPWRPPPHWRPEQSG